MLLERPHFQEIGNYGKKWQLKSTWNQNWPYVLAEYTFFGSLVHGILKKKKGNLWSKYNDLLLLSFCFWLMLSRLYQLCGHCNAFFQPRLIGKICFWQPFMIVLLLAVSRHFKTFLSKTDEHESGNVLQQLRLMYVSEIKCLLNGAKRLKFYCVCD